VGVFFASLEQSRLELTDRMMTGLGKIDSQKVRHGRIGDFELRALREAGNELRNTPMWVDDEPCQTSFRIAATARRLHAQHTLGLVIVDYLQIVESENRREQRHEQVSQTAKRLKGLARELKIPVVALAQLNRSMEEGVRTRRPRLSDLRESGGIEAAADTVWLMHRPDDQADKNPQVIDVQIAKQRNGPVGEFLLHYFRAWTSFQTPDLFPIQPRRSRAEDCAS
jgi:replicative DNA helicase